jgi:hypothetical protein
MTRALIKTCAIAVIVCMSVVEAAYALPPLYWNAPELRSSQRGRHIVRHGRDEFIFHEGRFYRHDHGRTVVVAPPFGAIVPVLPLVGLATLLIGGMTYYELNGVYYRRAPDGYVVVEQPAQAPAAVQPPVQQDQQNYWYYCRQANGYYPYVRQCPGGWMKVVPETTPPDAGGPPGEGR